MNNTTQNELLNTIATSSIELAAIGPKLAQLAADIKNKAHDQAQRTANIASILDVLVHDLDNAVEVLKTSSGRLKTELAIIQRIAYQTRLLSLNAAIEAARAGSQGATFAVVVEEVKRLSENTGQTAQVIEERMKEITGSMAQIEGIGRIQENDGLTGSINNMAAVNRQVLGIVSATESQLESVAAVHVMGDQVNTLTESLLLAIGRCRFKAHHQAQQSAKKFASTIILNIENRQRLESSIEEWLRRHPHFELAYVTDAKGRQFIDNIYFRNNEIVHDPAGFGCDWSARLWFQEAIKNQEICSTDIYRSSATGDFCFTVVAPLYDVKGTLLGVFGSDVNFRLLLNR